MSQYTQFDGTEEHDRQRITNWFYRTELPWLNSEMDRINGYEMKCEIVEKARRYKGSLQVEYALFYTNGYFHQEKRDMINKWVSI